MTKQGTILVVDDNKGILTAVQMLLGTCFEKVITISTPNKIKATLHDENIDVVLLDMNFSAGINTGNEGLFWLSEIKKEDASIQVVLFTAYADIDLAVRGIKEGATDFVVKPWDNAKLLETLKTAYTIRTANRKGISIATGKLVVSKESGMFWGESNAMQHFLTCPVLSGHQDVGIRPGYFFDQGTGQVRKCLPARSICFPTEKKRLWFRSIWELLRKLFSKANCSDMSKGHLPMLGQTVRGNSRWPTTARCSLTR